MTVAEREPREIVAGLLADRRLLAACAERDMGTLFRLLNHRGISTRRIAAAVDITQGRLYDYMNGKSRVEKLAIFEQIADAFQIPGHLLGLAKRPWEPASPSSPNCVSEPFPDGDDMAAMDAFRTADRQAGGGRLYSAVLRHLRDNIGPRLVDADGTAQVFAVAAVLTEMAGWMAHDSGQDAVAGRHFTRALPLAHASGDTPLAASIAASTSHLALQTGDPAAAVHWAQTGLDLAEAGPIVPTLIARLHAMSARALAAAGQPTPALRALGRAEEVLDSASEAERPWLSPFDAAALALESALVLSDLRRHDEARTRAEHAIHLRESNRARSLALSRITLADLHLRCDDLEAAVAVGHEVLAADPNLGSIRVLRQLDGLHAALAVHRSHSSVRALLQRFDETRRARMLLLADIVPPPSKGATP
ncbi:helix-turn-helix domain-containing protein [Streptomyces sp. NPDC093221]|uniref:helix-turn-helix domain-containing protein n=1 Tax=Streptomyces sp. NPDC093221 TaxID=3366032 RepID=UPI0038179AFE